MFLGDHMSMHKIEMGEMKIYIVPGTKLVNKRPYNLAHKYKNIV